MIQKPDKGEFVRYRLSQLIEDFKEIRNVYGDLPVVVYTGKQSASFVSAIGSVNGVETLIITDAETAAEKIPPKHQTPMFEPEGN